LIYVLEDETFLVKKANGETIILDPEESVLVLDHNGVVKGKHDARFKMVLDLARKDRVIAVDPSRAFAFTLGRFARLERMKEQL